MSARATLTPHMLAYDAKFADSGETRWLPYLIYFHPANHRSPVVNTDSVGFRYTTAGERSYSVADHDGLDSVRLLAGSSTVFGIGASSDGWTLPSRLNVHDDRGQTWLNFGGRSYNSTQELLLLTLYRHLLPKVDEIVLFSGFNNLGLARMPASRNEDHGTFFLYNAFQEAFARRKGSNVRSSVLNLLQKKQEPPAAPVPTMTEQIRYAADLTLRHLDTWKALASVWNAKITFILQPLSGWVRPKGSAEEEALFAELDRLGGFSETYGDILREEVNLEYAARLERGCKELDIRFVNMSPILADALQVDQWLFVDRIHFTDQGHDFVAQKVLEVI